MNRLLFGEEIEPVKQLDFELFYGPYPKHVARPDAEKMWGRLTFEEQQKALAALPDHIALWKAEHREQKMIPNPASWLNPKRGRRWEDEIVIPKNGNGTKPTNGDSHGKFARFVRGTA